MNKASKIPSSLGQNTDWGSSAMPMAVNDGTIQSPASVSQEPTVINGYMPAAPGQPGYNQMIAIGQASPHLPFRDWAARGLLSAVGKFFAWPFKMVGEIINAIFMAMIGILKIVLIVIVVPSAIVIGLKIAALQQEEETIRGSAAAVVGGVVDAGNGAVNGKEDSPPAE